jgi:hypothetical protein
MAVIWAFVLYALISFVVSYILVEYGQKYLYDEVTPYAALKVGAGALILAGLLTWTRSSFDTMFTAYFPQTLLLALVSVVTFVLIYRFQPLHGLGFGIVLILLMPGLATIVVQSVTTPRPDPRTQSTTPAKALRRGSGVTTESPKAPTK